MITNRIQLNTIEEAIDIRQGKIIIVVDDEDRETKVIFWQQPKSNSRNDQLHGNSRTWIDLCPLTESRCKIGITRHGQ
jgi:3,4-dihydroxy-2-butanone 4-phosphate synthase